MKRFLAAVLILVFVFSFSSVSFAAEYKDNPIDQAGDWFATMGKSGMEKDSILAQRKAERAAKFAEREAKKLAKEAEKAGNDAKKSLGF